MAAGPSDPLKYKTGEKVLAVMLDRNTTHVSWQPGVIASFLEGPERAYHVRFTGKNAKSYTFVLDELYIKVFQPEQTEYWVAGIRGIRRHHCFRQKSKECTAAIKTGGTCGEKVDYLVQWFHGENWKGGASTWEPASFVHTDKDDDEDFVVQFIKVAKKMWPSCFNSYSFGENLPEECLDKEYTENRGAWITRVENGTEQTTPETPREGPRTRATSTHSPTQGEGSAAGTPSPSSPKKSKSSAPGTPSTSSPKKRKGSAAARSSAAGKRRKK